MPLRQRRWGWVTAGTAEVVITTKLFRPGLRQQSVERKRLYDVLREGLALPLTLVVAPAGWGKSTIVADWAPPFGALIDSTTPCQGPSPAGSSGVVASPPPASRSATITPPAAAVAAILAEPRALAEGPAPATITSASSIAANPGHAAAGGAPPSSSAAATAPSASAAARGTTGPR